MEETWPEKIYPFAETRRVAQEFAQKEEPDTFPVVGLWSADYERNDDPYTFMEAIDNLARGWTSFVTGDQPSVRPSSRRVLHDTWKALQKLLAMELRPTDKDDIALITTVAAEFLDDAVSYFMHESDTSRGGELKIARVSGEFLARGSDFRNSFEAIGRQLAQDLAAFESKERAGH